MEKLLEISGLCKHYDGFSLQSIDLTVTGGSIVGLIGENGAGKTTVIHAALGALVPDAGSVRLFGKDIVCASAQETTQLKQDVGVVLDTCPFPKSITVADAGATMGHAYRAWDSDKFESLCERFGLPRKRQVKDLSRGMGMKLSLASALAHTPRLLVLDEATAGLDPIARDEILDLLREWLAEDESERAILMSSHITTDLDKIADMLVCLDGGEIAFSIEKDTVIGLAGIATCRKADFERLTAEQTPGIERIQRRPYSIQLLVADRFAFAETHPSIQIEPADVESYMHFFLKGERL